MYIKHLTGGNRLPSVKFSYPEQEGLVGSGRDHWAGER